MSARQTGSITYPIHFLLVLSLDHLTGATAKVPTVTLSKNGAGFGAAAGAVSEIGNGWYALAGNAVDRNMLGELLIHVTCVGCDPVDMKVDIITNDPYAIGVTAADVETELMPYFQLVVRKDAAIAVDRAVQLALLNANEGSGAGAYANTTDAQEAIRDKETDIETDTADIQARIPAALVGGNIIADVLAIDGSLTAADKLQTSADSMELGAAIAGTLSITQMSTNLTELTNNHYNGRVILWTSGPLLRQATDIVAYNGATKVLTYTAVTEAPVAGNTFIIV